MNFWHRLASRGAKFKLKHVGVQGDLSGLVSHSANSQCTMVAALSSRLWRLVSQGADTCKGQLATIPWL
jgi:hypothetical protein